MNVDTEYVSLLNKIKKLAYMKKLKNGLFTSVVMFYGWMSTYLVVVTAALIMLVKIKTISSSTSFWVCAAPKSWSKYTTHEPLVRMMIKEYF